MLVASASPTPVDGVSPDSLSFITSPAGDSEMILFSSVLSSVSMVTTSGSS